MKATHLQRSLKIREDAQSARNQTSFDNYKFIYNVTAASNGYKETFILQNQTNYVRTRLSDRSLPFAIVHITESLNSHSESRRPLHIEP